jgi:Ser/Thr protein kinase RdoA (MazF antagonist)
LHSIHSEHPYDQLTPDFVLDAIDSLGLETDSRILALNSYENRVYQVGIEDSTPLIAKFYRPFRWSREAILEEHAFTRTLLEQDISVISPLEIQGNTLHDFRDFYFALFARQGGHAPEVDSPETLFRIGRNIGRIHQAAGEQLFQHRKTLYINEWAVESRTYLLKENFIPDSLIPAYETLSSDLINKMQSIWQRHPVSPIRLHGDCHLGNILWRNDIAHFVDFDDCMNGPPIQDIWLLLSGDRLQQTEQLIEIIEGYEEFCDFDARQLNLIETLRTLRMMYYAAWLARRWSDPAFPMFFPWFNTERYWSDHILELREQLAILDEPPLQLRPQY